MLWSRRHHPNVMASIAQSNHHKLRGFLPLAHRAPRRALHKSLHARRRSVSKSLFSQRRAAVCLMEQNRTYSRWLDT